MPAMRARVLEPLRHRDYRLLAGGALSSLFGDGLFVVALPLQVYAISNVPTAMAVVGLVWSASQLGLLLIGGWASDRFERRRIMVAADLLRAGAIGTLGVLSLGGALELWHVLVVGAVVGASNAFFNPAAAAIVPDLLPAGDLARANAFLGVARPAMARLLGPAVGGLLVATAGPAGAFLGDAATFLVSAALVAGISRRPAADVEHWTFTPADGQAGRTQDARGPRATLRQVLQGLEFVRANRWCWAWFIGAAFGLLAVTGPVDMLLPFILTNDMRLDEASAARSFGLILSVAGLGSITASIAVGQLGLPRRVATAMYAAEAVGVAMLAVYGLMTAVWQAAAAAFVLGSMFAFTDVAWSTTLQRLVPRRLLGRVSSLDWLTALGLMPASFAVAGPLAATFGARPVLVGGAAAGSLVLLTLMAVPGARAPDELMAAAPEDREPSVGVPT